MSDVGQPKARFSSYAAYLDSVADPAERRGQVYFIGAVEGPVKVGFTNNLTERLRGLQTASAVELCVLAVIDGTMTCEAAWHDVLSTERIRGEWFAMSPRTIEVIQSVRKLSDYRGPLPRLTTKEDER